MHESAHNEFTVMMSDPFEEYSSSKLYEVAHVALDMVMTTMTAINILIRVREMANAVP